MHSFPAIMTSVARMRPSGRECLHPYRLSDFDLVTASLTLMAGKSSLPSFAMAYNRWTPVVVSSETPTTLPAMVVHILGFDSKVPRRILYTSFISALSVLSGFGFSPDSSNFFSQATPSWISKVASPPSSTIRLGPTLGSASPFSLYQVKAYRVHHQYSAKVSPFQANTAEVLASAIAAAASSCVEKMLQEHQRTSAPRAAKVSMRTAVCTVMCRDPVIFAPFNGNAPSGPSSCFLEAMSPGISTSARSSCFRPASAKVMSRTRYRIGSSEKFF